MDLNTRVIKEPRGFIRIITFIFAILAFSTTSSFYTESSLEITCKGVKDDEVTSNKPVEKSKDDIDRTTIKYKIEYPFKFEKNLIRTKANCSAKVPLIQQYLPMDFSSSAQFYVTVGVLSMLYSLGALVVYLLASKYYETNPLVPLVDLIATGVLALFWFAGSCAWAAGVSDIKHYSNPTVFRSEMSICKSAYCNTIDRGKWATLHISLIFGFGNVLLWVASVWFVFKETQFHQKPMSMPTGGTTVGGPQSFGYGDQVGQNVPPQGSFPPPQQYPAQY